MSHPAIPCTNQFIFRPMDLLGPKRQVGSSSYGSPSISDEEDEEAHQRHESSHFTKDVSC